MSISCHASLTSLFGAMSMNVLLTLRCGDNMSRDYTLFMDHQVLVLTCIYKAVVLILIAYVWDYLNKVKMNRF